MQTKFKRIQPCFELKFLQRLKDNVYIIAKQGPFSSNQISANNLHDLTITQAKFKIKPMIEAEPSDEYFRSLEIAPDEDSSVDPTRQYFREIGRVSLLTAREEIDLARKMERPRFMSSILADVVYADGDLTLMEAKSIMAGLQAEADRAKNHMTEANLRLVVSIAKRHMGKGVDFLDLVQEGNIGLMHAVEKYDYHKGFRFSTYATWWIRQTVTRAIADQARTIRWPVHMVETAGKVDTASRRLLQIWGREPTAEEVAEETTLPPDKVEMIFRSQYPLSLDKPLGDANSVTTWGDTIEDPSTPVADLATHEALKKNIQEVMECLTGKERRVLELRHGLIDSRSRTLEEVGREFGVTRERIRQIEAKALRKLRHPSRARKLRDYLNGI